MKLRDILTEKNSNVAHSDATERGVQAAHHYMLTHGDHKGMEHPKCEYPENSEEWRAWHEAFKNTVQGSEWYGD